MKLSELILTVLNTVSLIDRSKFKPEFSTWLSKREYEHKSATCVGCLAGAYAFVNNIGNPTAFSKDPTGNIHIADANQWFWGSLDTEEQNLIDAIDDVREGAYDRANKCLGNEPYAKGGDGIRLAEFVDPPDEREFLGWHEFDRHLKSLLPIAKELKQLGQ